ncbi:30S ribosomal protein S1 [Marinococcus luteus]|uniref:SSU ribosomal protein S1P n=1 Tax=Marinococcus luteus TaxID=1122204 RepID=A0A1H2RDI0_9BACI|nr:30S ribosomal protein S1 [Marinococcus luteus]MDZ5782324.1 30S ribosomal protein S1 [Marinococcus luteus]SDW17467.1 SSU ribosomal protein S1P [Marinococcus luteus]
MADEMNNELEGMKEFNVGDIITATVTKVEEKQAYADAGYKVDAVIPISELSSLHVEKVDDVLKEGDQLEFKVTKMEDDELVLSRRAALADKSWGELQEKYESGDVIEAQVAEIVKGGLVVDLGVRGFIPASLVERYYVEDFSDYQGKTLRLKIAEIDPEENKLILSQRAVLDEEAEVKKKEVLENLNVGDTVKGTVQRLTNFGAFVDVGGVDGLVHISQMAHHRVESPGEIVNEGDEIEVKILAVDPDSERVSLSIKDTLPGPWTTIEGQIEAGDVIDGQVKRLVSFGAFVEVAPGVEGLVHISQIANRHIGTPGEVLEEGQAVTAKVLDINPAEHRISLSIRELENPETSDSKVQSEYEAPEEDHAGFSLGDMVGDQLKKYKK